MRKILMLSPCDIFPPIHGSSITIYNTIKYLSKTNLLTVLLSHLYSQNGSIDLIHPNLKIHYCKSILLDRLGYKSLFFNFYYLKSAYEFMKKSNSDIIQCELLWTVPFGILLKKMFNKPLILVEENVEYLKFKQFDIPYHVALFVKKLEKMSCKLADKIIAVSQVDKNYLMKLYGIPEKKITVISHCVDANIFKYSEEKRSFVRNKFEIKNNDIVLTFVGKLDYIPNIKAVEYIAKKISPVIIRGYPGTKFLIIGQNYEHLMYYASQNIIFTGFIDSRADISPNLSDYLSASDIVLVPLDSGSGTRLKILEAAACSRPVVSTRIGVEGEDFVKNKEILVTDKVDSEFIANVMKLIKNKRLRYEIGDNARKKVIEKYIWEKEIAKFEKIYEEVS